jgi:hypothetical protein
MAINMVEVTKPVGFSLPISEELSKDYEGYEKN